MEKNKYVQFVGRVNLKALPKEQKPNVILESFCELFQNNEVPIFGIKNS